MMNWQKKLFSMWATAGKKALPTETIVCPCGKNIWKDSFSQESESRLPEPKIPRRTFPGEGVTVVELEKIARAIAEQF